MVLIFKQDEDIDVEELEQDVQEIKRVENQKRMLDESVKPIKDKIKNKFNKSDINKWLEGQYGNEVDILKDISKNLEINLSEASNYIQQLPIEPIIADKNIPDLVKELRDMRRTLKGEQKIKLTKGIDHLITAYEDYVQKSLDTIYWLKPYQSGFKRLGYKPSHIEKLHNIKDNETRKSIIELCCKMWESDLELKTLDYGYSYSKNYLSLKESRNELRKILKDIPHQSIRKSKREMIEKSVKEIICNNQGLSSNEIHSRLSLGHSKISTPQSVSKILMKMGATKVDNEYYLVKNLIKKDLYSYVAGFIDSDGYITMDSSLAPRVGMIATGKRGKAFFQELEKELKCGRLHLDQKVGENSRSQHRLNFYSQNDIATILEKCIPHLRMKKSQGKLIQEAIRIKKNYKKEEWAKPRLQEIFKLIKYENWKDSRGQGVKEFQKYDIDPEVVVKYHDNCKMQLMDSIESGVE
jgi:hypothetical protein|tara:strand:+ start:926 stop:2326 length:1401 start_codon:yes stop_codon:yes gene_type:complete